MGNTQAKQEISQDNKEQGVDINQYSTPEETNINKQPEINESPNIEDDQHPEKEHLEKFPYDNLKKSENAFDDIKLTETKIITGSLEQKEENKEEDINNIKIDFNVVTSNTLNNPDLNGYIVSNEKKENVVQTDKKDNNSNLAEMPYTSNTLDIKNINNNENINITNNNIENNKQVEEQYTSNNLNINNNIDNEINTEFLNVNSKEAKIQNEEPYTFNNLDLNNINNNVNTQEESAYIDNNLNVNNDLVIGSLNNNKENNFQGEETKYTFDADIYKHENELPENKYSYNAQIFSDVGENNNNLISTDYNYNIYGNDNIVNDNNYLASTINNGVINYDNTLSVEYLPTKTEDLDTNIYNNINYDINNINKFSFGQAIPQIKNENVENHFVETQNIYNDNNINIIEEPQKETQNNIQIDDNNIIPNSVFNSNDQPKSEKSDNNNDNEDKLILNINDDKIYANLHETKTLTLNDNINKSFPNDNDHGKNIEAAPELKQDEINDDKNGLLIFNNDLEVKEQENNIENNNNDENNSNISNQIKEIKEMPEMAFQQRDLIFNKNNIKVIKIEDDETNFCSNLFTPLFRKLFG